MRTNMLLIPEEILDERAAFAGFHFLLDHLKKHRCAELLAIMQADLARAAVGVPAAAGAECCLSCVEPNERVWRPRS